MKRRNIVLSLVVAMLMTVSTVLSATAPINSAPPNQLPPQTNTQPVTQSLPQPAPQPKKSILYAEPMEVGEVTKPVPLKFNKDIDYKNYVLNFTDIKGISDEYRKDIIWAVENGLLKNEKGELRPNEQIKMREFCLSLYDLRWKYHQLPREEYLERYKCRIECDQAYEDTITSDLPEARFLLSLRVLLTNTIYVSDNILVEEYRFILEKNRYNPMRPVEKANLYYISGNIAYLGLLKPPTPEYPKVNDFHYRNDLMFENMLKYYQTIVKNKNLVLTEEIIRKGGQLHEEAYPEIGIGIMQQLGLLKYNPTFEDLELTKPVTRIEFLQFMHLISEEVHKSTGKDFRVDNDWHKK